MSAKKTRKEWKGYTVAESLSSVAGYNNNILWPEDRAWLLNGAVKDDDEWSTQKCRLISQASCVT